MNEFIKRFRFFVLTVLISAALSSAVSLGMLYGGGLLLTDRGIFNFKDFVPAFAFFGVLFFLFATITMSHRFASGRVQEVIYFLSSGLVISALFAYIFSALMDCKFEFAVIDWYGSLLKITRGYLMYYGYVIIFLAVFILFYGTVIDRKMFAFLGLDSGKDGKAKQVVGGLENSRWMTKEEKRKNFKIHTYTKLSEVKKDGVPVSGKLIDNGRNLEVAFMSPCHALVIGSTGSGKTTTFVSPMIQLLAATAAGSSMVITDPKGELFNLHSKFLKSRGYDVKVIDLRDTYSSYRWNPLDSIYDQYENYKNAHKLAVRCRGDASKSGLVLADPAESFPAENEIWYEFDGKAYADYDHLVTAIKVYRKKVFDEVYEDLNDLVSVLIPIENEKDPMWEKGARSIVLATLLAMLEDSSDESLGMTKDKFNFFNLAKILQNSADDYRELRNYFRGRSPLSRASSLSKQVVDAATQTRASYMSIVYEKLTLFNDAGICALTSVSDFTAANLAERPTALFLKIPDEKDTRHNLAAIFILNIYKTLIKIASATAELSLPRNVYFIMDEFGNMPKIEKFDKFITVGRSRKIWFVMIIQSYAQLNNVYGDSVADIVKGNCGVKMFIGSNDMDTCKEYSELCGNITVSMTSTSTSAQGDVSYSNQTQVRPLIYPSELQRLNHPGDIGHSIIVTFGNYPLKTYFSPSFQVPFYKTGKMDLTEATEHFFDENALFYDIRVRNQKETAPAAPTAPVAGQDALVEIDENEEPETAEETAATEEDIKGFSDDEKEILDLFRKWKETHPEGTVAEFLNSLSTRTEVTNG